MCIEAEDRKTSVSQRNPREADSRLTVAALSYWLHCDQNGSTGRSTALSEPDVTLARLTLAKTTGCDGEDLPPCVLYWTCARSMHPQAGVPPTMAITVTVTVTTHVGTWQRGASIPGAKAPAQPPPFRARRTRSGCPSVRRRWLGLRGARADSRGEDSVGAGCCLDPDVSDVGTYLRRLGAGEDLASSTGLYLVGSQTIFAPM
ncbi:uncharacterized protein N7459_008383 [Penicillium hispanicum]|uniref:uncharacterized protein n=1 Tax=Penicillium hispanicum TaxID=1080232 RepID=UPI002541855D|nr:uncharacterized protein N7459_008383 [Penicillium hispanicum]KAJ5573956.1 hypothetical protein N7459_008383 [Penicillium hispanicum]